MKNLFRSLWRHQFFTLSGGIIGANAITLLSMPFLTRIYPSESFGYFAVYLSISTIVGSLSTLRFEYSVATAQSISEARVLSGLSLASITGFTSIAGGLILALNSSPMFPDGLSKHVVWLTTTASIALQGLLQLLTQLNFRNGHLTTISVRNLVDRISFVGFALIFSPWKFEGLILAQTVGLFTSSCTLYWTAQLSVSLPEFRTDWRTVLAKYRDFPLKNVPSAALGMATSHLPPLLLSLKFPAQEIGLYSLAQRVFDSPTSAVGTSLGAVYYRRILQASPDSFQRIFRRTLLWSLPAFALPLIVVIPIAQPLVVWIFGAEWSGTADYLVLLIPVCFFRLLFSIQQSLFVVRRKLDSELMISLAISLSVVLGIGIGVLVSDNMKVPVSISSALSALAYLSGLIALNSAVKGDSAV